MGSLLGTIGILAGGRPESVQTSASVGWLIILLVGTTLAVVAVVRARRSSERDR